jgi:hypothetical protein
MCAGGGCGTSCGKLGQPACMGGVGCTAPDTINVNGNCEACGGNGERCCRNDFCARPYTCNNATCAP